MSTESVSDVLFGQIRGGVLALLYGRIDESFYLRQIARHLGASAGAVQRELKKLAAIGLISRKSMGNQVFYQVNQDAPVFPEMRSLVNKTVGIFGVLSKALHPLAERIIIAFIYGSIARHEERPLSDIDLMLIGEARLDDVLSLLRNAQASLGRDINPTIYSVKEFRRKLAAGNHFVNAVMQSRKIFLIGNPNELGKMAGVRMAKAGEHHSE